MLAVLRCKRHKRVAWTYVYDAEGRIVRFKIKDCEHVLGHTGALAYLVELCFEIPELTAGLDKLTCLRMVLHHDVPCEWEVGDSNGQHIATCEESRRAIEAAKLEQERASVDKLCRMLPTGLAEDVQYLWSAYAAGRIDAAKLIKQLDKLEFLLQALAYNLDGEWVPIREEFLPNVRKYITSPFLASVVDEIEHRIDDAPQPKWWQQLIRAVRNSWPARRWRKWRMVLTS